MPEYKPAITQEESDRIEALMQELQDVQTREQQIAKELRKLIYKTERIP